MGPVRARMNLTVPRNFPYAGPVMTLYERILDESKKKERKHSCGNGNAAAGGGAGEIKWEVRTGGMLVQKLRWDELKNFLSLPRRPLHCGSSEVTKGFVRSYNNLHFYWIVGAGHFKFCVRKNATPFMQGNMKWPLTGGVPSEMSLNEDHVVERIYIAGYQDSSVRIWDVTFPVLVPMFVLDGKPLAAYCFNSKASKMMNDEARQAKIVKFSESIWNLTYYASVQAWVLLIIKKEPWSLDTMQYYDGWPNQPMTKDFAVMMSHHVVTSILIGYAYLTG
ncbi:hypothetical protein ABZP36_002688 [Zizania latifolia]